MSRLHNYLYESFLDEVKPNRSTPIDKSEFYDILFSKCRKSFESKSRAIYRGVMGIKEDYLFIDPSKTIRNSAYTSNYYLLLMKLIPAWNKYPDLMKSVIAATSNGYMASRWGESYRVFPYDKAILGVCPAAHFWGSFTNVSIEGMDQISNFFHDITDMLEVDLIDDNETDPKKMLDMLKRIDAAKKSADIIDVEDYSISRKMFFSGITNWITGKYSSLLDYFTNILDPEKNEFELAKIGDNLPSDVQVWTESPCILVRFDLEDEVMESIENE